MTHHKILKTTSLIRVLFSSFFVFISFISTVSAQAKPAAKPVAATGTDTLHLPKLSSKFGAYTDSSKMPVAIAKQILKSELKVTDSKGVSYKVVSYFFAWRKKEWSNDLKTGQLKTLLLYNVTDVKDSAAIPAAWQNELTASLQAGEELFFDEIVAENIKTKKNFRAPSVRLLIK